MQPTQSEVSVKVFISYSHADQEWRKKLESHLSSLKYSGEITIWQDQEIPAGANWEYQINTHLDGADIILLLISADFIASKYCWSKEVQAALQCHQAGTVQVIPIILRPVRWQNTPLGQFQALPTGAKPVTQWNDHDAALENVVEGIQSVVEDLKIHHHKKQWIEIGDEHNGAERYTEALAAYEQAIRLNPNDATAYHGKGFALIKLKRHQEALSAFEEAIRFDPNYANAYHNKGFTLQELDRRIEAQQAFKRARQLGFNPYQNR